jgi:hypothetical protein
VKGLTYLTINGVKNGARMVARRDFTAELASFLAKNGPGGISAENIAQHLIHNVVCSDVWELRPPARLCTCKVSANEEGDEDGEEAPDPTLPDQGPFQPLPPPDRPAAVPGRRP